MDPEIKKALDALKAAIGEKNVDVLARAEQLGKMSEAQGADIKLLRADIDKLRTFAEQREKDFRDLVEKSRVDVLRRDPIHERRQGLEMLGMIVRSEMARMNRLDLPAEFKAEVDLVRAYRAESLARATLTPMGVTGSYLVPTVTDQSIQSAIEEVSDFLGLVDLQTGLPAGGTFNFTFLTTRPVMQPKRASSDTAMTASDPVFAQMQISPVETYVTFPVDNKMFLMTAIGLGGYFEGLCRDAMAAKLAYWALRGDGTAAYNSITGLLNETDAAYILSLPAGKTGFADLTDADLNKIKAKCLKRGRGPKGRWVMDLEIQGVVENIDRTGKVPIITYGQDGEPRLKQNPIVIEEDMPGLSESAAATGFALFGDPATLLVGMVGGIQIASDASVGFLKNQTNFRATTIVDMKRKPVATLMLAKTAAQ